MCAFGGNDAVGLMLRKHAAAPVRRPEVIWHEASFEHFVGEVSVEDLVSPAETTFEAAGLPSKMRPEVLARLRESQLTISRQQVLFHYKRRFEAIHN